MRYTLVPLVILLSAVLTQAQTGPCTESEVQNRQCGVSTFTLFGKVDTQNFSCRWL
jgi:hypothetical protein